MGSSNHTPIPSNHTPISSGLWEHLHPSLTLQKMPPCSLHDPRTTGTFGAPPTSWRVPVATQVPSIAHLTLISMNGCLNNQATLKVGGARGNLVYVNMMYATNYPPPIPLPSPPPSLLLSLSHLPLSSYPSPISPSISPPSIDLLSPPPPHPPIPLPSPPPSLLLSLSYLPLHLILLSFSHLPLHLILLSLSHLPLHLSSFYPSPISPSISSFSLATSLLFLLLPPPPPPFSSPYKAMQLSGDGLCPMISEVLSLSLTLRVPSLLFFKSSLTNPKSKRPTFYRTHTTGIGGAMCDGDVWG